MNDIISNFLSSLKNGVNLQKQFIDIPKSKRLKKLIYFLIKQGYIVGFLDIKLDHNKGKFRIFLKYDQNQPVFNGIFRISKPSRRVFINKVTLKRMHNPYVLFVLSTNQGYLNNSQALLKQVGGELICVFY